MRDTPEPKGTTLEILQAYPLGTLEVTHAAAPHLGAVGVVTGLDANTLRGPEAFVQTDERAISSGWRPVAKLLPLLRDFSQLCDPLPDGTIPAVEVAKLALSERLEYQHTLDFPTDAVNRRPDWVHVPYRMVNRHGNFVDNSTVIIMRPFDVQVLAEHDTEDRPTGNQVAIADYLRRNLFALPVNGKLLVEGTDYLRKDAAR